MKNIAIIGIGNFGYYLALELVKEGVQVLAVDVDADIIEQVKEEVHKAVQADAKDRAALEKMGLQNMDCVVVCLGEIEASVLTTLHLKEMNTKRIMAKALNADHGKLLKKVGASEVVFPEKDTASRVAFTLTHRNVLDHVPLAEGYSIVEIAPPTTFLRKSLKELNLRKKFGVQVIVVKEMVPLNVLVPKPEFVIKDSDVLYIMGKDEDIRKIQGMLTG